MSKNTRNSAPLAERMRPQTLSEVIGHKEIVKKGGIIDKLLSSMELGGVLPSLIFWGPPGCGKTTLARIIAKESEHSFISLSAISSGVKDIRSAIDSAKKSKEQGINTIVFIDEIHRFNKSQQDTILGAVESGLISIIGATTENPSFEVNRALLSRATVIKLDEIRESDLTELINRAVNEDELLKPFDIELEDKSKIAEAASGDARITLNILELALRMSFNKGSKNLNVTKAIIEKAILGRARNYDKSQDYHYDNISAFIKSMRGSDPDAALFWMMNMLEGGEDPKFIARRISIFASEDIGMADSQALLVADAAFSTIERVGLPEGKFALVHAVVYCATAPKSNSLKIALKESNQAAIKKQNPEVPYHLRNGVTQLMKDSGYGKGYRYPHDYENNFVSEEYMPKGLESNSYYVPGLNPEEDTIRLRQQDRWGENIYE